MLVGVVCSCPYPHIKNTFLTGYMTYTRPSPYDSWDRIQPPVEDDGWIRLLSHVVDEHKRTSREKKKIKNPAWRAGGHHFNRETVLIIERILIIRYKQEVSCFSIWLPLLLSYFCFMQNQKLITQTVLWSAALAVCMCIVVVSKSVPTLTPKCSESSRDRVCFIKAFFLHTTKPHLVLVSQHGWPTFISWFRILTVVTFNMHQAQWA